MQSKRDIAIAIWVLAVVLWLVRVGYLPDDPIDVPSLMEAWAAKYEGALRDYREDVGALPPSCDDLSAFVVQDPGAAGWDGPYLDADEALDAWGNVTWLRYVDERAALISAGPDGEFETDDDIRVTLKWAGEVNATTTMPARTAIDP
jgi:hypothetical protein